MLLARIERRRARCADRLGDFRLAHDQRRQQPHHIVARRDGDHLLGAQRVDQFAARHDRAQADQQSFAADFGNHRGIAILQLGQPLLEQQRRLPHALEKARREHHIEHRIAGRHGERIAAEGRAVGAGGHALGGFGGGEAGADAESRRRAPWRAP